MEPPGSSRTGYLPGIQRKNGPVPVPPKFRPSCRGAPGSGVPERPEAIGQRIQSREEPEDRPQDPLDHELPHEPQAPAQVGPVLADRPDAHQQLARSQAPALKNHEEGPVTGEREDAGQPQVAGGQKPEKDRDAQGGPAQKDIQNTGQQAAEPAGQYQIGVNQAKGGLVKVLMPLLEARVVEPAAGAIRGAFVRIQVEMDDDVVLRIAA